MCGALAIIAVVVIVVGDVGEFAAKSLILLAECVLPSLMLSGNGKLVIPRAFGSKSVRSQTQGFPSKTRKM